MVSTLMKQSLSFGEDRYLTAMEMIRRSYETSNCLDSEFQSRAPIALYSTRAVLPDARRVDYQGGPTCSLASQSVNRASTNLPPPGPSKTSTGSAMTTSGPSRIVSTERGPARTSRSTFSSGKEKIGGVAAHLDYDMDHMVDFVSQMAYRMHNIFSSNLCVADIDLTRSIFHPQTKTAKIADEFRSFVSQVLSSTRLPSSTILLGLLYISKRISIMSYRGSYTYERPDLYSMLIVGLTLGSKFLDDNTFQNRSWSEVSHIRVVDLNRLEYQWLADIKWNLHIDHEDPDGLNLWVRQWNSFQDQEYALFQTQKYAFSRAGLSQGHPSESQFSLEGLDCHAPYRDSMESRLHSLSCRAPNFGIHTYEITTYKPHAGHDYERVERFSPYSPPESGPNTPENAITNHSHNQHNKEGLNRFKSPACRIRLENFTTLEREASYLFQPRPSVFMGGIATGHWPFYIGVEPSFTACA